MTAPEPSGWTVLPVMYRDASNYKAYGDILLEGIITDAQIAVLRASLNQDTYYVPGQLGLDHLALDTWPGSAYEDDHNWHELFLPEIRTVDQATSELIRERGTQEGGTVAEFVAKVQKAAADGWNPNIGNPW